MRPTGWGVSGKAGRATPKPPPQTARPRPVLAEPDNWRAVLALANRKALPRMELAI